MKLPGSLFCDALALVGLALIGGGLWWIYPPLALVVIGVGCILTAIGYYTSED